MKRRKTLLITSVIVILLGMCGSIGNSNKSQPDTEAVSASSSELQPDTEIVSANSAELLPDTKIVSSPNETSDIDFETELSRDALPQSATIMYTLTELNVRSGPGTE